MNDDIEWPCQLSMAAKSALLVHCKIMQLDARSSAYSWDGTGEHLYYICNGSVMAGLMNNCPLVLLMSGRWFGGSLLYNQPKFQLKAVSLEPSELFAFPFSAIQELLPRFPELYKFLYLICGRNASDLINLLHRSTGLNFRERTAQLLLDCRREAEIAGTPRLVVMIPQTLLAEIGGVSRPRLNQELHALQSDGLITLETGRVVLHDINALRAIAQICE